MVTSLHSGGYPHLVCHLQTENKVKHDGELKLTRVYVTETGFFLSFTVPKLYSCYTHQISQKGKKEKKDLHTFHIVNQNKLQVIVCRGLFVSLKS